MGQLLAIFAGVFLDFRLLYLILGQVTSNVLITTVHNVVNFMRVCNAHQREGVRESFKIDWRKRELRLE